ncbi:urease accessory protein UreE [Cobetia sp. L2A1]|uniref:urease accessory protein UreE n=1 Tax=Cobetia sp. L2A1 TaxID=2686360 RepID=UPI00131E6776|nr:urease accessory protein UreE [Cobetia sp. L2A1]
MIELTQRLALSTDDGASAHSGVHVLDTLTLPLELRIRGRLKATTDGGRDVGLFLDRGPVLREGDRLSSSKGEVIRIQAAPEPVVTAYIASGLPMAALCYHLGNRHVQLALGVQEAGTESELGWVRFPPDHVLEALAMRLGASLEHHEAPFDPEPGAYAQAGHAHSHAHDHDHDHSHAHEH